MIRQSNKEMQNILIQDETRISTLGPYAAALSFILASAHRTRVKANGLNKILYKNKNPIQKWIGFFYEL